MGWGIFGEWVGVCQKGLCETFSAMLGKEDIELSRGTIETCMIPLVDPEIIHLFYNIKTFSVKISYFSLKSAKNHANPRIYQPKQRVFSGAKCRFL